MNKFTVCVRRSESRVPGRACRRILPPNDKGPLCLIRPRTGLYPSLPCGSSAPAAHIHASWGVDAPKPGASRKKARGEERRTDVTRQRVLLVFTPLAGVVLSLPALLAAVCAGAKLLFESCLNKRHFFASSHVLLFFGRGHDSKRVQEFGWLGSSSWRLGSGKGNIFPLPSPEHGRERVQPVEGRVQVPCQHLPMAGHIACARRPLARLQVVIIALALLLMCPSWSNGFHVPSAPANSWGAARQRISCTPVSPGRPPSSVCLARTPRHRTRWGAVITNLVKKPFAV